MKTPEELAEEIVRFGFEHPTAMAQEMMKRIARVIRRGQVEAYRDCAKQLREFPNGDPYYRNFPSLNIGFDAKAGAIQAEIDK